MRLMIFMTWLFVFAACFGGVGAAQDVKATRVEIIRLLGQLPEIAPIRQRLIDQGFRGEKLALAEDHSRRIMNDPAIAGYIADRVIALYDGNLSVVSAAEGLVGPLYDSGVTHLPLNEQLYYYRVQRALMDGMTPRECGMLVKRTLSPIRLEGVFGRAEARLSVQSLSEFYRIQRKAMRIGVTRGAKRLSPSQEAHIEKVIFEALRKRVAGAENGASLARAFDNLARANPKRACDVGKLYSDVVLDLKGRDLQLALLYLSTP